MRASMFIHEALPALEAALYSAQAVDFADAGLHDVDPREIRVNLFPQLWGSTATGYGGLGGSAMTWAHTVVLEVSDVYFVYFSRGRLAYRVTVSRNTEQGPEGNAGLEHFEAFSGDLQQKQMASRRDAVLRYGAVLPSKTPKGA